MVNKPERRGERATLRRQRFSREPEVSAINRPRSADGGFGVMCAHLVAEGVRGFPAQGSPGSVEPMPGTCRPLVAAGCRMLTHTH